MKTQPHPLSRKYIYMFFLVMNIMVGTFRFLIFPGQGWMFHTSLFFGTILAMMLAWESILIIGRFLQKYFPVAKASPARIILQVLMAYIVILILGESLFNSAGKIFNVNIPYLLTAISFLLFFLMSVVFNLIYFGSYYFFEWKENLIRSERLQREQAEVRYDALRNQLNPHFLFNALTSLNSLIFEDQQLASDFLQQLSKMFRYTLLHRDKEMVSIKTEIEFVSHFIFLVNTRFSNAVHFNININESDMERGIVPVTMQVLLENALKHNIISKEKPLQISITSDSDYLIIENSINKKSNVETSNKFGLQNLKSLYQYLSENPVEVIETENKFTIKIPLL